MTIYWATVNDDELRWVDRTVDFLQGEFCPPGADPMWSAEYFHWKLGVANPAGPGHISVAVIGDRVVGVVSLTRKRLWINGKGCIGGEVGDAYSAADVRRQSRPVDISPLICDPENYINKSIFGRLASDVRFRAEADGISIIYGTPNTNAYPGWVRRLGYFDWKEYDNRSFSRPTSKFIVHRYPALRVLSKGLAAIDKSLNSFRRMAYVRGPTHTFHCEPQVPLPTELDLLWEQLKPTTGFCLVRDAAYWRHRYVEHPLANYVFLSVRERGHLLGVVVARIFSAGGGRRAVSLVEWMTDDRVPFGYVLCAVLHYFRDSDAEVFSFWAEPSGREAKAAAASLFFPRNRVPIILADTPQARSLQSLAAATKFYVGSADAA